MGWFTLSTWNGQLFRKWVPKENIHLTLKFLGNTPLEKIDNIKETIKENLEGVNAIECNITHIGAFPKLKFPRVIWAGIEKGSNQIADCANNLQETLSKVGFEKEERKFQSHITICRVKQVFSPQALSSTIQETNDSFPTLEFLINKIVFFESRLSPKGPICG